MSRVFARFPARCLSRGRLPACALALLALVVLPTIGGAKPAPDSFADLAAKLLPAVVNISSTQTIKPGQDNGDDSDAPPSGLGEPALPPLPLYSLFAPLSGSITAIFG